MLMRKRFPLLLLLLLVSSSAILQNDWPVGEQDRGMGRSDQFSSISQENPAVRPIANWTHGICDAVCVQGSLAFIGDGFHVTILDITDKSAPLELSTIWLGGLIGGLRVSGDHLYAAAVGTFWVVDISDPYHPVKHGSLELGSWIRSMRLEGGLLYLAQANGQLRIVNASDSYSPEVVGIYTGTTDFRDVSVLNGCAYIAARWGGLVVVNVTEPSSPSHVATVPDEQIGVISGVCKSGPHILTTGSGNISVLNVSVPSNPVILNTTEHSATSILAEGELVFAFGWVELLIMNISNPLSPDHVASISSYAQTDSWNPFVLNGHAYVATYSHGLAILDATEPEDAYFVGEYATPYSAWGFQVANDHIFANEWIRGMYILDLADLSPLDVSATLDTYGANSLVVKDNILYADNRGKLSIYDVTDPLSPQWLGNYDPEEYLEIWAIEVVANRAYLIDRNLGLIVVDVSNPQNPRFLASYSMLVDNDPDVCVSGGKIYVVDGDYAEKNVLVLELTPSGVQKLGNYSLWPWEHVHALEHYKGYLFVGSSSRLSVLDTSDPSSLEEVTTFSIGIDAMELANDLAYIGGGHQGVFLLNMSDPSNPVHLGNHSSHGDTVGVLFHEGMIITAEYEGGIWIYEHDYDSDGVYSVEEYLAGEFPVETEGAGVGSQPFDVLIVLVIAPIVVLPLAFLGYRRKRGVT